jgi:uncharacterized membrane protein
MAPDTPLQPAADMPDPPAGGGMTLVERLRAYLLAGILVTAPIAITIYIAWVVIGAVDGLVSRLIPAGYDPERFLPFTIPGIGLVMVLVVLILIGMFTAGYVGRMVRRGTEAVVLRMPVIRSIYGATKQIFETVLANQSSAFREVVLVEWPRPGVWTLGFITGAVDGEIRDVVGREVVSVFIPTTPNPTGGYLLFFPRAEVTHLDMTVEEGIKMVVSTGIVTPGNGRAAPPRPPRAIGSR